MTHARIPCVCCSRRRSRCAYHERWYILGIIPNTRINIINIVPRIFVDNIITFTNTGRVWFFKKTGSSRADGRARGVAVHPFIRRPYIHVRTPFAGKKCVRVRSIRWGAIVDGRGNVYTIINTYVMYVIIMRVRPSSVWPTVVVVAAAILITCGHPPLRDLRRPIDPRPRS